MSKPSYGELYRFTEKLLEELGHHNDVSHIIDSEQFGTHSVGKIGPKDIVLREIREMRDNYDKYFLLLEYLKTAKCYLDKIEPLHDITIECARKLENS